MNTDENRVCATCGSTIPSDTGFCRVCGFRGALQASLTSTEPVLSPTTGLRFGHYEILTRDDGTPLELWRGAMGVVELPRMLHQKDRVFPPRIAPA